MKQFEEKIMIYSYLKRATYLAFPYKGEFQLSHCDDDVVFRNQVNLDVPNSLWDQFIQSLAILEHRMTEFCQL
jgi:hypothetical protein